jgi:hypothetical protein
MCRWSGYAGMIRNSLGSKVLDLPVDRNYFADVPMERMCGRDKK